MMKITSFRHLANIITVTRIMGVVSIFWLTPYKTNLILLWTVIIYTFVSLTDFLDGWVARRLNIVSDVGKILDPLADKILVLVFLPLLEMQVISSFPVFIILAREFAIMALRVVSAKNGTIISATFAGKLKTAFTLPVCGILLARVPVYEMDVPAILEPLEFLRVWILGLPQWSINLLIYITVVITIWSFLDYFGSFIWQRYVQKYGGDEERAKKSLRTLVPNTVTMLNFLCGTIAAVVAAFGQYHLAVLLILFGILLDALDGTLARKLNVFSKWGSKFDSKADVMSFGIAPAVVIFRLVTNYAMPQSIIAGFILGIAYFAAVYYRLNRFDKSGGHSLYFTGLPSPIGSAIVILAAISEYLSSIYTFAPIVIIVCVLMVSRIPYMHNIASKKTFLRYLRIPTLIFFGLTIINLLKLRLAYQFYVYEVLFCLTLVYVVSPVFYRSKIKG